MFKTQEMIKFPHRLAPTNVLAPARHTVINLAPAIRIS